MNPICLGIKLRKCNETRNISTKDALIHIPMMLKAISLLFEGKNKNNEHEIQYRLSFGFDDCYDKTFCTEQTEISGTML